MKKLVSSSDAAKLLGISLQGIHYRIKKGQLESLKKDGKTYVYIDEAQIKQGEQNPVITKLNNTQSSSNNQSNININELALKSKDEQILTLKKTIKFMKRQYTSEIHRLDKNQKKILDVFQSEVDLLKSAFHEMKNIYQLDHKREEEKQKLKETLVVQQQQNSPQAKDDTTSMPFMDLKDFFVLMRGYNKSDNQIKAIILDKVKSGDKRFIYKKDSKEVLIFKSDFLDLI